MKSRSRKEDQSIKRRQKLFQPGLVHFAPLFVVAAALVYAIHFYQNLGDDVSGNILLCYLYTTWSIVLLVIVIEQTQIAQ